MALRKLWPRLGHQIYPRINMRKAEKITPHHDLLKAKRCLGYSLREAVADLIDNSISANCTEVEFLFDYNNGSPIFSLKDDGDGMSAADGSLIDCFKLGQSYSKERTPFDLGRFGCGLKTASLSQARKLIVISKQAGGEIDSRALDLDWIEENNEPWTIGYPELEEVEPFNNWFQERDKGTIIVWKNWDRAEKSEIDFAESASEVQSYVSLCFHKFIESKKVEIRAGLISLNPIGPVPDSAVKKDHEIKDGVSIDTYLLSNADDVSANPDVFNSVDLFDGLFDQQGIYIYRGNRLLNPQPRQSDGGNWCGFGKKTNASKLARVVISYTNIMDEKWQLDIRKTKSTIPSSFREKIIEIQQRARYKSSTKHRRKQNRTTQNLKSSSRFWIKANNNETKSSCYKLNRKSLLVSDFIDKNNITQKAIDEFLAVIEKTLPYNEILSDYDNDKNVFDDNVIEHTVLQRWSSLAQILIRQKMAEENLQKMAAASKIYSQEPFCHIPNSMRIL